MISRKTFRIVIILTSISVFLVTFVMWNITSEIRDHYNFISFMENKCNALDQNMPDKIAFGRYADEYGRAYGRSVTIEDPVTIEKIVKLLREKKLVQTRDYQKSRPLSASNPTKVKFDFGSKSIQGGFRVGGRSDIGFGLLLERQEDYHWFYGAWDPWPIHCYWFDIYPHEWTSKPPSNTEDELIFEVFAFLFFIPVRGIELHLGEDGFDYSSRNPAVLCEYSRDLLRVGNVRDFFELHPELKTRYTNRKHAPVVRPSRQK